MKSINAKKIAAVVAGATLLGVGLAFAGPVTFQNVAIIGASGQPLVQIVVGSKAQITDGVAAANIAAAVGNLAYTTVGVTASVNATNANNVLHVTVTNPSAVTVTNQQVWLNQTGAAYAAGAYGFSALIGSVLNRGIQLGSPASTKALQGNNNYAYPRTANLTASPAPSPYFAAQVVPPGTTPSRSTGGGFSLTSFTSSNFDNLLQITNAQQPALLSNSGQYGETENIWVTGFPVYNQQIGSFALMSAGGAYQASFSKPITVTSGSPTNGIYATAINNAAFRFLGQNWTIIGFTLPGASASNSTSGATNVGTTATVAGGTLQVASSLSSLTTVYVGQNVTGGKFTAQLTDIGQPNSAGSSPAAINLYYNGKLTNVTSIGENTTSAFNISGTKVYVKVGQTFAGLYAYQKYAKIQIYSNVFVLRNGATYNQTYDPGWNVNLLWTNTTSSSGKPIQLQSIIVYNASPQTLKPGQSLSFINNPSAWNLEFIGDNLGSNYDSLSFSTTSSGPYKYKNVPTGSSNPSTTIPNVTEPAQILTATSGISNAFTYGGQTSSSVKYDLTPYYLAGNTPQTATNVVLTLTDPGNFVTNNYPMTVLVQGTNNGVLASNTVQLSDTAPTVNVYTTYTNITVMQIQTTAYPGISIVANAMGSANVLATLSSIAPTVQYFASGQTIPSQTPGANVIYNQQNGQLTSTFTIAGSGTQSNTNSKAMQYFNYTVHEYPVPGNSSAQDSLSFSIYNSTVGSGGSPIFFLNASSSSNNGAAPGTRNNMTYTSTQKGTVNAPLGFRTERGSSVATESAASVSINYATAVDQLLFALSPSSSSSAPSTSTQRQYGPYSVGQAVSIPGVSNVTVSKITASATLSGNSGYTITGLNNLTATPSVSSALQPVWLKNLTTTPLVVLDSQANPASSLVLIGSGYVNTLSQQVVPWSNYTSTTTYLQAFGNKILIAGYSASQTTAAANQFIQDLYAAASTS